MIFLKKVFEFESFIKEFPETTLPKIYELIEKYKDEKEIIIFKSRAEANSYIDNISLN
jgi:hypothetical protein